MSAPEEFPAPLARVPSANFGAITGLGMGIVIFGCVLFGRGSLLLATFVGLGLGLLFGIGFAIFAAWTKRAHSRNEVSLNQRINRAVLTGHLPATANLKEWLPALERSRQFWKAITVAGLIMFPALAVVTTILLVEDPLEWRSWVQLAFFTGFGVFSPLQGRLQLRRIRNIRTALETARSF